MDKKKLKTLLKLLGFGLIIGAIVVTLVTGIEKVGHYEFIKGFKTRRCFKSFFIMLKK